MSYRFTLQMTRIECLNEQYMEWGADEMHLIGFGVSRKGHLFTTGYRSLGSYHDHDVSKPPTVPQTFFEYELEEDGLEVLFYFWLVEEDGGGVRSAANDIDAEFRASYFEKAANLVSAKFPRDCIPFTAFYRAISPLDTRITEAGTAGLNDEVYAPVDLLLRHEPDQLTSSLNSSTEITTQRSKDLGEYLVTFRYTYHKINLGVI